MIYIYERCLGAKLNESKSKFVPLTHFDLPNWIHTMGYKFLRVGEVMKYLGCPIGLDIQPTKKLEFLLGKVRKRLRHWSNKLMSFPSRVTLIKHVLRAILVYAFMAYSFLKDGFKKLEGICRDFLWGYTPEGMPKKALVAWEDVTYPKEEGGMGIIAFQSHATTLKMCWISKILTHNDLQWVQLAHQIITRSFKTPSCRSRYSWTPQEMLLLDPELKMKWSHTLKGILGGWEWSKDKRYFYKNGANLPEHFTMVKLTRLLGVSLN